MPRSKPCFTVSCCVTTGQLLSLSVLQVPQLLFTLAALRHGIFQCVHGLVSSCGVQVLEHMGWGAASVGAWLPCGVWDLSSPGTRDPIPVSCLGRHFLNYWSTREALFNFKIGTMLVSVSIGVV